MNIVVKMLFVSIALLYSLMSNAAPENFSVAKIELRKFVYHDQNTAGTLYCGCKWKWAGASGGIIDQQSCGYQARAQANRASRIEWEHIMPASNFGRARQCWQRGGRENCNATDPIFNRMEADMHNLAPSIGEVNADRSNFNYGQVALTEAKYGQCDFKVSFSDRVAEPRNEVKGHVARVTFYMADRYNIRLSSQQERLLLAWDKQYPATAAERMIESRVAQRMGHHNEFITGQRKWSLGHVNAADGIKAMASAVTSPKTQQIAAAGNFSAAGKGQVRGNKNSRIYHLASGCPSYDQVGQNNRVEFDNETIAVAAGYRKAKNCK